MSFFNDLFLTDASAPVQLIENVLVGPIVAVLSFVCSVGNVPLAAVLWAGGISFSGVMAFIYADLIVIPIVLIYRKFYGWKVTWRIVAIMFVCIVLAALAVDGIFSAADLVPTHRPSIDSIRNRGITWNYTTALNIVAFLVVRRALRADDAPRREGPGLRDDRRPQDAVHELTRRPDRLLLLGSLQEPLRPYGARRKRLISERRRFCSRRRSREALVGLVGRRGRSTRSAARSCSTSRSVASSRFRHWLRSSCAIARSTGPAFPTTRLFCRSRERRRGLHVEDGLDARLGLLRVLPARPARTREAQFDLGPGEGHRARDPNRLAVHGRNIA